MITIFSCSSGDSVVSLCIAVWEVGIWILLPPGLPLSDSCAEIKPWVLQGRNLARSPVTALAGGGCVCPGLAWRGSCSIPPWQNGEYRKGLWARKKARLFFFQIRLFFFLNTMCLPIANYKRRHKSQSSLPSAKLIIFCSPRNAFIEHPAGERAFGTSGGAGVWGLEPGTPSLPTLGFLPSLTAPLLHLSGTSLGWGVSILSFVKCIMNWISLGCLQRQQTACWNIYTGPQAPQNKGSSLSFRGSQLD